MTSPFARPSEYAGGSYFKVQDHMTDLALMVEPTRTDRDVPNTYNGITKNRDEVTATVTIFANSESLQKGEPTAIEKDSKFVHGMLTSTLSKLVDNKGVLVGVIRKIPTKNGSGYAFRDVTPDVEAQVANYYTARESAVTEALASVPSFD